MTDSSQTKAQQLLDAQVAFWLDELTPSKLLPILREELAFIYQKLDAITLKTAVDQNKVKATAHRYVVEMEIGGGIPELFGEIANIIYEHPTSETTTLGELFSHRITEEFLEKVFEPGSVLDQAIRNIRSSEPFKEFLAEVVFTVVKNYLLEDNQLLQLKPFSSSMRFMRNWMNERAPDLSDNIEEQSKQLMESGISRSLSLVDDTLGNDRYRENAFFSTMNLWEEIQSLPISQYQEYVSEMDLQEFMVLGYEFWLEFRHTDFLQSSINAGVEFFFNKYGEDSLQAILSELGITEEMIISEIENYAGDLADLMKQHGIAEAIIRRHLQRFYFNESTLAIVKE